MKIKNVVTLILSSLLFAGTAAAEKNQIPSVTTWPTILVGSSARYRLPAPAKANSLKILLEKRKLRITQRKLKGTVEVDSWKGASVGKWNALARELVAKNKINPPAASRIYALLSVGQYDGLVSAWKNKQFYRRRGIRPASRYIDERYSYPSQGAVIAGVSSSILNEFFPNDTLRVETYKKEHQDAIRLHGRHYASDISAGNNLGRKVASAVIRYAKTDGSDATFPGTIPTGPGVWYSSENKPPLLPVWGNVRTWFMQNGAQFRASPPPDFNSAEFKAAVQEVRAISDTRTAEQLRIAQFWADGGGTSTPPGHWNEIALTYFAQEGFTEIQTARALAIMNMAIMDAGICCWDTKFTYWLIRPSQADPAITVPVGLPNFPSYASGHATFSGAAARVLGYILPSSADAFSQMADEAAVSRLYGGIHYRFDSEVGLTGGRKVGDLAVARDQAEGSVALRNRQALR